MTSQPNIQDKKSIAYTKSSPASVEKTLYSRAYPEPIKATLLETRTLNSITSPEENQQSEGEESQQHSQTSRFGIARTAILILALSMLAAYVSDTRAPSYMERLFISAKETLMPVYEKVYAAAAQENEQLYIFQHTEESSQPIEMEIQKAPQPPEVQQESGLARLLRKDLRNENAEQQAVTVSAEEENPPAELAGAGIIKRDLSRGTERIYSQNETKLTPDLDAMAVSAYPIAEITAEEALPQVLIVHTHGTECYSNSASGGVRSTDRSENVVRVGKELSDTLNFYGITTLHSETMHDEASYLTAYNSSRKEVAKLLELHPTIKYVIDLHRDAIPDEGNSRVKTYTEINGEGTAQIMLVIGTNAGGGNHPKYTENLTVASHLQSTINDTYPTLARPINIRNAIFNQNLSNGCMLLEVGSDANTLEEALRAARLFGRCFAQTVQ